MRLSSGPSSELCTSTGPKGKENTLLVDEEDMQEAEMLKNDCLDTRSYVSRSPVLSIADTHTEAKLSLRPGYSLEQDPLESDKMHVVQTTKREHSSAFSKLPPADQQHLEAAADKIDQSSMLELSDAEKEDLDPGTPFSHSGRDHQKRSRDHLGRRCEAIWKVSEEVQVPVVRSTSLSGNEQSVRSSSFDSSSAYNDAAVQDASARLTDPDDDFLEQPIDDFAATDPGGSA